MGTKQTPRSYLQDVASKLKENLPSWDICIEVKNIWEVDKNENNFAGYDALDDSPFYESCVTLNVRLSIFCKWKGEKLNKTPRGLEKSEFQLQVDKLLDFICENTDFFYECEYKIGLLYEGEIGWLDVIEIKATKELSR